MGMTIIKNFSMPHNCYDCDLHNYHECDLTTESIEEDYCWNGDSREKHCPLREVEAIPTDQYEARLKADLVAMLEELNSEIRKLRVRCVDELDEGLNIGVSRCSYLVQQKINTLKENEDGSNT